MRLSVFVKGLWHETCSDQIAETLYEATSQTETFYQRKLAARACRSTRPRVYICVERNILLIVEHKSYVAHIYVAVTQLTQMEYQQHFIYYKYFYQTDLVCQKICINQESWLLNWTAHKCTCQATRRLRRSSRSCKLFLPSQPQPSLLSGSFIIGVYVIDNILVSLPPSFFIMHLVPLVVE